MSSNTISTAQSELSVNVSKVSIFTAFCFGAIMIFAVGFIPTAEIHNAAHDTRHTAGFPCH